MIRLVPNCFDTDRQFMRFFHYDLPSLETKELWHELYTLRPLLWWRLPDDSWLRQRAEAIGAELAKRRGGKRQGIRQ